MTSRTEIDEHSPNPPYRDLFDRYVRPGEPVVLRGAAAQWRAIDAWTPEFLVKRYGQEVVDFADCATQRRTQRCLADYFELPEQERAGWYLVDWDFRKRCPELLKDIIVPEPFSLDWMTEIPSRKRPDLMWIYIGHAGVQGPTHIDNFGTSAWLAVLQGRKRVVFPTAHDHETSLSGVNLFDEGGEDPRVSHRAEALLGPGDVLYVPAGRWHAARNESYCLSVTANFVDGANFYRHHAFATREWFGALMLENQMEQLAACGDPGVRERLEIHLAVAMRDYRRSLEHEIAFLESLSAKHRARTDGDR